jgi:hypothetical protein
MKKRLILFMALLLTLSAQAQDKPKKVILPGKGRLDVEQFNRSINTNMDISQLSLSELRVLRNAFAARKGYIFDSADLRSIFSQTSWYYDLMWKHFEEEDQKKEYGYQEDGSYKQMPLKYTAAEQAFMAKIKAREKELSKLNFSTKGGQRVNVDNVLNPYQLTTFDPRLKSALGKNGFTIVPGKKIQLFHVYEKNDYSDFPSFVTTDLYLQLYHFYFDNVLRSIEEEKFDSIVNLLSTELYKHFSTPMSKQIEPARRFNQAYFVSVQSYAHGGYIVVVGGQAAHIQVFGLAVISSGLGPVNRHKGLVSVGVNFYVPAFNADVSGRVHRCDDKFSVLVSLCVREFLNPIGVSGDYLKVALLSIIFPRKRL